MSHHQHKTNKMTKEERNNLFHRFNKELESSPFLEVFQKIMIERLLLNADKKYHPKNVEKIINSIETRGYRRNAKSISTKITGGYILTTNVEADFYILLQETIKDVVGNYMPMDEFIHILLTWFYQYYSKNNYQKINLPFRYNKQNKRIKLLKQFNNKFSEYYKNIV
jgi:hypothetical protein